MASIIVNHFYLTFTDVYFYFLSRFNVLF